MNSLMMRHTWQSGTGLALSLSLIAAGAAPFLQVSAASAQARPGAIAQTQRTPDLFAQPADLVLAAGTTLAVRYDEAEKIVVTPQETAPITLTVAESVRSARGVLVIPEGSKIMGELRPVDGGTQFVAESIMLRGSDRAQSFDATSEIITETETIKKGRDAGQILKGAAIGAAAAAVLSEILGDLDIGEVLIGAGLGALGGLILGKDEVEVVVVNPETDLELTLESDFSSR